MPEDLLVTNLIPIEFGGPELTIRFGSVSESATRMPMPETAMDKDNRSISWQHNVRLARQVAAVQAKSIPEPMQN